jgi:hypothetical protein
MQTKVSEQLSELLQSKEPSDYVDVIVELHQTDEDEASGQGGAPLTRNERITQSKDRFDRRIVPLQETIRKIGGEITGQAWINETLRVRVPADKVKLLSDDDDVAKVDIPHPLTRDATAQPDVTTERDKTAHHNTTVQRD